MGQGDGAAQVSILCRLVPSHQADHSPGCYPTGALPRGRGAKSSSPYTRRYRSGQGHRSTRALVADRQSLRLRKG